ncbi:hypothetical protein M3C66_007725 [Micrococcus luteus]|nr:hypothetical protein [Micrococcus luteus]
MNAQIDARTKATMRADLPALAKELKIGGGSGIEEVSGTVTLDATGPAIREFWSTGATTFKANGADTLLSSFTAVVWRRNSQGSWGYQVVQDSWTTPTPTPDTTAPVAGTLAVAVTDAKADLAVSGASDDRGYVSYSFSKDNGATWTAYQDSAKYTFTGLTASTAYQFRHRVKDAAGNVTTGTAVSKTTAAVPVKTYAPGDVITSDDFTGDGPLAGRTTTATLGGDALKFSSAGGTQTSGGVAVAGTSGGYSILPVNRADVEVSFTLVALPTASGANVSLRDTGTYRYVCNILPNSVRVQRYGPSGGTVVTGMQVSLNAASLDRTFTFRIVGSTITLTGTQNTGEQFTLTGTDTDLTAAAGVGVDLSANSGAKIDNLVVTAR